MVFISRLILVVTAPLAFTACSGGGSLSLDSSARKITVKGSPFVAVNQGGRALIVEQGKTATTGVHGWVAVQSVGQKPLTSGSGTSLILNGAKPPTLRGPARE